MHRHAYGNYVHGLSVAGIIYALVKHVLNKNVRYFVHTHTHTQVKKQTIAGAHLHGTKATTATHHHVHNIQI